MTDTAVPSPLDLPTTTDFVAQRGAQVPKRSDAEPGELYQSDTPDEPPGVTNQTPAENSAPAKPKPLPVRACPHCKAVIGLMMPSEIVCPRRRRRG